MDPNQRKLRHEKLKKKRRNLCIIMLTIWTGINFGFWFLFGFNFESNIVKILVVIFAILTLIGICFLLNHFDKKINENERQRRGYRFR